MNILKAPGLTTITLSLNSRYARQAGPVVSQPQRTYLDRWKESLSETPWLMDVCLVEDEPFSSPWFTEVVDVCRHYDLTLSVDTGPGFSYTELEPESLAGVSQIRVQLNSLQTQLQDAQTLLGQHRQVIHCIEWLRNNFRGAKVLVVHVVEDNVTEIEAIAAFARGIGFRCNFFPCPTSSCHPRLLSQESFWEAARRIAKLKDAFPKEVYASIPLGGVRYDNLGYLCPAVLGMQLHLNLATGDVTGCLWSREIVGSLKEASLAQIYDGFRRRVEAETARDCLACPQWLKCYGGCLGNKQSLPQADPYCPFG